MAKIMLVEDDNNLREIYEARLLAEGYQIISAKDGEEALAMAVKEKPDLIISDVMMPKISGFDMLDILRSTPETKDTKVIMMTALSQAEDKARAGKLGADRYLVKSQVTLEDVAKVTREVLQGDHMPPSTNPDPTSPAEPSATTSAPQAPAEPPADPAPTTAADPNPAPSTSTEGTAVDSQINDFLASQPAETRAAEPAATPVQPLEVVEAPAANPTEAAAANAVKMVDAVDDMLDIKSEEPAAATPAPANDSVSISGKKVIQPPADNSAETTTNLNDLLAQEKENEEEKGPATTLPASTVIDPSGNAVTPTTSTPEGTPPKADTPGNVIQPGSDPGSIAL